VIEHGKKSPHARRWALALTAVLASPLASGCSDETATQQTPSTSAGAGGSGQGGSGGGASSGAGAGGSTGTLGGAGGQGGAGAGDPGPNVDTSDPQLYETAFTADEADPDATEALGTQVAFLDTRVPPCGLLVVYLHGAGTPATCGSNAHGEMLAGLGFHVLGPCYLSAYGVGGCGDDIEGCRLEAFEGVDHHPFIDVSPPDSIEVRVARGLAHVQAQNPEGDWTYFLDGDKPRWEKIVISGISHGASTSGVVGIHRLVRRVVSLSGPLDTGQAWLEKSPITPIDRFFGFSHTGDDQHPGHLQAFEVLGLTGEPTSVDGASPPYGGSHRLISSAQTDDGHLATQAGGSSPGSGGDYEYLPVWTYLYTEAP
jgi:hypothetical protein